MNHELLTNNQGFSSASRMRTPFPVLDGELAVPCNPEPALPGSNPRLRSSPPGKGRGKRR